MKAIAWERYLARQRTMYGKTVFSTSELANAARATPSVANVALARLVRQGILIRVTRGVYATPGAASLDDALIVLAPGAYMTGARVLFDGGFLLQSPSRTLCFTDRRRFRSVTETPWGRIEFRVVRAPIYEPPPHGARASAEQALLDFAWVSPAVVPMESLGQFRHLNRIRLPALRRLAARYPDHVAGRVEALVTARPA